MVWRLLFLLLALCASSASALAQLTAADVQRVIHQAAMRANRIAPNSVIAVTNREGYVLGVWVVRGGQPTALEVASCVAKAGTASFLSSNANAFTSRTAGFIIQQHFPPGVRNLPPGPLVGVGFSNLPFSDVNRFKRPDFIPGSASPGTLGSPIPLTSLNGIPGGVPLYKNGVLVGGVGVTGTGVEFPPTTFIGGPTKDEDLALAGQRGFEPRADILGSNVFINGISLPYVESSAGSTSGAALTGNAAAQYPIVASPPPFPYPLATFSGVQGQIRQPIMADPLPGRINGQPRLTRAEVESIIAFAADRVRTTRAGIRLPIGTRMEVFITVVNNPNAPGVGPTVLGAFRTGDATIFSWDVAVQKARTAVGFSSNTAAFSTRTVGFLAQSNFPPGIDPEGPGPLNGMQEEFSGFDRASLPSLVPTSALLSDPPFAPNPRFPNGITIFPGGFPLYRHGQLIGAIGISGDGVDQDDIVGASGTQGFLAPGAIVADRFEFDGTRLPYTKFPRDPEGVNGITPVVLPVLTAAAQSPRGADFNGDRNTDILWQNKQTGQRAIWLMNGASPAGQLSLPTVSIDWEIAGASDFNGDSKPDLIWQNMRTGHRGIWAMNGASCVGVLSLPKVSTDWEIAGAADFNGDSKPDLIWQNNRTGARGIWLMNGARWIGHRMLPAASTNWKIASAADFDRDGQTDLLWQNMATGARALWLMRGAKIGQRLLPKIPTQWRIAGTGDYGGDGDADILWQNVATGQRAIWLMDGAACVGVRHLPSVATSWEIRNR